MDNRAVTWGEFVGMVKDLMTVDSDRAGTEAYVRAIIRQGTINVQQSIDEYRINHETVYQPQDLVREGRASKGVKPPQSVIKDVQLIKILTNPDGTPISEIPGLSFGGSFVPGGSTGGGGSEPTTTSTSPLAGIGSPEGVVAGIPGQTYWDTEAKALWVKQSGTDITGWYQLLG